MIPWHPHTETPAEPGTVAIIAVMLGDPPERDACLKEGLYHWAKGQWMREAGPFDTALPEAARGEPYWWCREGPLDAVVGPQTHGGNDGNLG